MTPILVVSLAAAVLAVLGKWAGRQTAINAPEKPDELLSHWEWWGLLQETIGALTADTIDAFDPHSIPTTRKELLAFKQPKIRVGGAFAGISFTANEYREMSSEPVYLYDKYDAEYADIEVDQLLDVARTFKISERGVGKPKAVRVGQPVYDPNYMREYTIWKCITHDDVRMKFNSPDYEPLILSHIARQFVCTECQKEKIDPTRALKRMGVQPVVPGRWDAKYIETQNNYLREEHERQCKQCEDNHFHKAV